MVASKRTEFTVVLFPLVLVLTIACGSGETAAPAAASEVASAAPADAISQTDAAAMADKTEDVMTDKSGDAMADKADDVIADETEAAMADKSGDAMEDKSGDAMAAKTSDAMAGDAMTDEVKTTLVLTLSGIDPLQNGFHYEGWVIVGGAALSTGKFNIGNDGGLIDLAGNPIVGGQFDAGVDISEAAAIILTIEPAGDTDADPSGTHYLAGTVSGHLASLDLAHASSLNSDFSDAWGKYILATPTDDPVGNENSGLWFLDLSSGSPVAGLGLPELPGGWKYEGWAVIDGVPVTTGTFTSASGTDDAAPYSGPGDGPPFPGEDFLNNAPSGMTFPTDLAGGVAVISIEPSPDDSPSPFTLKPLVGAIPAGAVDHSTYELDNNSGKFPIGTAAIR